MFARQRGSFQCHTLDVVGGFRNALKLAASKTHPSPPAIVQRTKEISVTRHWFGFLPLTEHTHLSATEGSLTVTNKTGLRQVPARLKNAPFV